MSILGQVQASGAVMGVRAVIAAAEKIGKTTFAAGAPDALLIPLEQGFAGVNVNHTPMITSFAQFEILMSEITAAAQSGKLPHRTLILDSATALEVLIHEHTIALDNGSKANKALTMEAAHGGYGKAYEVANGLFDKVLAWADMLAIHAKLNIVITCHVFSSKVKDPTAGEYDSWDLRLHSPKNNRNFGKRERITQWADVIGYMHEPIIVSTVNGVQQGVSRGQGRVLAVERTPAYVAGNRYGMKNLIPLPPPPANSWNAFARGLYDATQGRIDVFNRTTP